MDKIGTAEGCFQNLSLFRRRQFFSKRLSDLNSDLPIHSFSSLVEKLIEGD